MSMSRTDDPGATLGQPTPRRCSASQGRLRTVVRSQKLTLWIIWRFVANGRQRVLMSLGK